MAATRLRRCADTRELERVVDDMAIQGYKIVNRSETSALLKKAGEQSVGIHVLLFCFTAGFGNIIYWAVKRNSGDTVAVQVDK